MKEEERALRGENDALQFHGGLVRLDLYRLFCYIHSSKHFADLTDGTDSCSYQPLRHSFEKDEIVRILIATAVFGRRFEKRYLRERGDSELSESTEIGTLQRNLKNDETVVLNVREGCNKIIHAEHIVIEEESKDPYYGWLKPRIYLYSSPLKNDGWLATIDIDKFVSTFSDLASLYE